MDITLKVTKKRSVIDGRIVEYYSYEAEIEGETVKFQPKPADKRMLELLLKHFDLPIVDA